MSFVNLELSTPQTFRLTINMEIPLISSAIDIFKRSPSKTDRFEQNPTSSNRLLIDQSNYKVNITLFQYEHNP
jgi:hypothetical protein